MTTFAQFEAGNTNIVFAKDRTLVLGWMETNLLDPSDAPLMERRYALHPDGRILVSAWERRGVTHMNKPGLQWTTADTIPETAEFIGSYEPGMFPPSHDVFDLAESLKKASRRY